MPEVLRTKFEKVAVPFVAATEVVEPPVKTPPEGPELIVTFKVSLEPVPEVTRLPYWSSTLTFSVPRAVPAVPVAGGAVEKTNLLAAAGLITVEAVLVTVVKPVSPAVVSEALKV